MKAALVLIALCACVGTPSRPAGSCWMRTEVFFGLSKPGGAITAADFDAFAHDEIETRLPEGFTLLQSQGEWQGGREESRVLLLVHRCGEKESEIDALRSAYKLRFNQQSVPRVDTSATASF